MVDSYYMVPVVDGNDKGLPLRGDQVGTFVFTQWCGRRLGLRQGRCGSPLQGLPLRGDQVGTFVCTHAPYYCDVGAGNVKALGVDHITTLAAANVSEDIGRRLPRVKGFEEKLARPAGEVEMLVGMDNQGWMPRHVESSSARLGGSQQLEILPSPNSKRAQNFSA
jgi:hypothetical protein